MQTLKNVLNALIVLAVSFTLVISSCSKNEADAIQKDVVIFEDRSQKNNSEISNPFDGKITKVTKLGQGDRSMDSEIASNISTRLKAEYNLNFSEVTKTEFYEKDRGLYTIPFATSNAGEQFYLHIMFSKNKYTIAKMRVTSVGDKTQYEMFAEDGNLMYSMQVNSENRIGKLKIGNSNPSIFKKKDNLTSVSLSNFSDDESIDGGGGSTVCASKPFNECMNCMIIKICGSDWVCILTCGAMPLQCAAGAALACVVG
jgi:hypothetical protein